MDLSSLVAGLGIAYIIYLFLSDDGNYPDGMA